MRADLILTNAVIRTADRSRPLAEAMAVWNGSILGFDDDIAGLDAVTTVDCRGRTITPGFIDAHTHLGWTGMREFTVDVTDEITPQGVLARIREAADERGRTEWIEVTGYDQRRIGGAHLTAAKLDAAGGGRPVWVKHFSGHASVASTAALAGARDQDLADACLGRAGLLLEEEQELVSEQVYPYPVELIERAVRIAAEQCAQDGVTSVVDAGIGAGLASISAVELRAYQNLAASGRLPVRATLMPHHGALHPLAPNPGDGIELGLDLGIASGFGGERLALGPVKFWFDGGMMARTAAFSEPYTGTDNVGMLAGDRRELIDQVAATHASGYRIAIHAIGDVAIDAAIEALRAAHRRAPGADTRPRLEHGAYIRDDQLAALADLGVTVVAQPCFLWTSGDDFADIMGPERTERLYRGRSLLDAGVRLVASTDRPHAGTPLRAIQVLVDRRSQTGRALAPDERITVEEALAAYTIDAARAAGSDEWTGSLAIGKRADFVVLDRDPFETPVREIGDITVLETYVDGVRVWDGGIR
ncbi:amidohydrolase [Leucobacter sp.]